MISEVKIEKGNKYWRVFLLTTLVIFVAGSIWIWRYVNRSIEEQRKAEFLRIVENTQESMSNEMYEAVERLYDLRGFVESNNLNSKKWRDYLLSTRIEERYPEVYTFAYAPLVKRTDLDEFVGKVRQKETSEEYKNYAVFPASQNAEVFPLQYIFSQDEDLNVLLGYDLGTSENQLTAIQKAVFEDTPVMTDLLHLGLVIQGRTKTGYVVMLPVYSQSNMKEVAKEDINKYFVGLVGFWVEPKKSFATANQNGIGISVFDEGEQIYSMGDEMTKAGPLKETREVTLLNKKFRFDFAAVESKILSPFTENLPLITAIGLIFFNLMLAVTVALILISRKEAMRLADEATKDLRKFKLAVEGVSDHVVITDPNGVIIYANEAAEKITGYKREYMEGKKTSLWGKQMGSDFYKKFWKIIKADKKPFWGEVTNRKKNGEIYEAEINVSPILDDKGRLLYFVGIEKDLTRTRAMEKMKTEFISLASHQLRTPLSAIKWFGKMLVSEEAGKLNPTQKEYAEKIYESNEREIGLVNSLLNVSRVESGKIVINKRPTDLITMVEMVIADFRTELDKGKKTIKMVLDSKIPEMMIDGDLVRHVYTNLISNAIRYTKEGGNIFVKVYLRKNMVMSEVKDNGIGIPKREQIRVFEKFFRASNALKKETDGNGLGLYLSKVIVESSGGKIGFRSSEGKGSTFWFTLPLKMKNQ